MADYMKMFKFKYQYICIFKCVFVLAKIKTRTNLLKLDGWMIHRWNDTDRWRERDGWMDGWLDGLKDRELKRCVIQKMAS